MFCSKCGNQLEDTAKFCDKCGNNMGGEVTSAKKEILPDNEVIYTIVPKFKYLYFMWSTCLLCLVIMIVAIVIGVCASEIFLESLLVGAIISAVLILISFLSSLFKKIQIKHMKYEFFRTKIEYSDSFLNKAEKEVKYKHIRETVLSRRISDRIFKFGTIILHTNAESGFGNGIVIPFVENSEEMYKKIKELLENK